MARQPTNKRPTSQDVADLAGVSVTTVSFVINDKSGGNVRISDETRKKVWDAVEALNYRPSSAARALRTRRSNLLALMIPHIAPPYHPLLAAAVQREAEQGNLDVIIYSTRDELQREKNFLDVLISRSVDGVIIHSHQLSGDDIDSLVEAGVAVVIHGNSPTHPYADNVMIDEIKAAEEAVTYLIRKGHVRIGTIAGPEATWDGRLRKEGYLKALSSHNLPIDEDLICEVDFFREGAGALGMKKFLSLREPPSAVFAASDHLAVDALLFALDSGLSVPEDVAIIGFDDTPTAIRVRPRLTTIHKDVNKLGTMAVQLLLERIDSESPLPARQKLIAHHLVCRESA
ncbi:MAG: LacI family DNA-binding transcriptional regulator [Anaerolineae bacterium]